MARKTINQLTELTEVDDNDELAVYDTSTSSTKKTKVFQIAIPVGVILPYGGAVAPDGWLLCNGEEKDISAYQNLYDVIGNSFGTASVNTKFVLPDMREAVPKGAGLTGKSVGAHNAINLGAFQDDRIQNIVGTWKGSSDKTWIPPVDYVGTGAFKSSNELNASCGGASGTITDNRSIGFEFNASYVARTGSTTEVKSIGVNYIIKY